MLCHKIVQKVKVELNKAIDHGLIIEEIIGYRAQMSKGEVNSEGERTELSNHSFGLAFDINPRDNGLYINCFEWNPEICRLIKGGPYNPQSPLSLGKHLKLRQSLENIGFKWGGEIKGRQKDFMHFSLTGN